MGADDTFWSLTEDTGEAVLPRVRVDDGPSSDDVDFRLTAELGRGGSGVVHLAEQRALRRIVALKRVHEHGAADQAAALLREARITARLEHPNIVPVHLVGRDADGVPFVVMKVVRGASWREVLRQEPATTPESVDRHLDIWLDVANAIAYAHENGVVHRDIKPANVVIGNHGQVMVIDWGLALADDEPPLKGVVAGTPAYMPPEMASGESVDRRSDVYLLGATLFQVLTGNAPHAGSATTDELQRARRAKPLEIPASIPGDLAVILLRACAPRPDDRYPNAGELRDAVFHWRRRRSALALVSASQQAMGELRQALSHADPDRVAVESLTASARFGFDQALARSPGLVEAQQGLRQLIILRAEDHLARRDAIAAAAILRTVADPPSLLVEKATGLSVQLQRERDEQTRAKTLAEAADLRVGRWQRAAVALSVLTVTVASFTVAVVQDPTLSLATATHTRAVVLVCGASALFLAMVVGFRKTLLGDEPSRLRTASIGVLIAIVLFKRVVYALADGPILVDYTEELWILAAWTATMSVLDRYLAPCAAILLALAGASVVWPEASRWFNAFDLMLLPTFVIVGNLWSKRR